MFDQEFLEKQKKILLERKEMLEERLGKIGEKENGSFRAKFPDYGDSEEEASLEYEDYDNNLNLEENLNKDLEATDKALKRIEKGTYGTCTNCGKEMTVSKERLEAYPAASTCLNCEGSS